MKALVTGATGFVGPWLIEHLQACGDDVVAVGRTLQDHPDMTDPVAVRTTLELHRPDVVYHLAGSSDVGGSWRTPLQTFRTNAEGTLNLILAAAEVPLERLLLVGSADVYGLNDAPLPWGEDTPLRPANPYAASKAAADLLGLEAFLGHAIPAIRVRPFNHLGPGQSDRFVASALARQIAQCELDGTSEISVGNLDAQRDFTDVRDVVRAYRLLVAHGEPGEVYNVCRGAGVAIQSLAEQLLALAKHPMTLVSDPARMRPSDLPVSYGDNARLVAATDWSPAYSLTHTLRDLLDWWRSEVAAT